MLLRAWKATHIERERRQRQAAWRGRDLSHEDLRRALETSGPLRAIYEAGMQDYVANGGDLDRIHSRVSMDMARRLISMGSTRSTGTGTPFMSRRFNANGSGHSGGTSSTTRGRRRR